MIEFKQIIGRGTRLYEGKDYFTVYDFVKAHQHFSDSEWDGEPEDNTTDRVKEPSIPDDPEPPAIGEGPDTEYEPRRRLRIKLANGKERTIRHMVATTFWSADGRPMSAAQFVESLYGLLPDHFRDEDQLRAIWSDPQTRKGLLDGLTEGGFGPAQMHEMQKDIDADDSDLFDVLAYIAFELPTLTREERAHAAKVQISAKFTSGQQGFLDFVLSQYVRVGVEELDQEKLSPLLRLRYRALADATDELGRPEDIRRLFAGFRQYLYRPGAQPGPASYPTA